MIIAYNTKRYIVHLAATFTLVFLIFKYTLPLRFEMYANTLFRFTHQTKCVALITTSFCWTSKTRKQIHVTILTITSQNTNK